MSNTGWEIDKKWADQFTPEIQAILGQTFFELPTVADDQLRNTDLICFDMAGKRIGCRIRSNQYIRKYGYEITIRSSRPQGTKTEYQKIIEGWGDYFFYGFCNVTEETLIRWLVGDLKVFRETMIDKEVLGQTKQNTDGSSGFKAFRWVDLPPPFFVKFSPSELAMSEVCLKCLVQKIPFNNRYGYMICPKCCQLSDFSAVLKRYETMTAPHR